MYLNSLDQIKREVKELIITTLNFENVKPEDILDGANFFSGENIIKIDSIDVLEIVVAIQTRFNVKIDDQNLARNIVNSVNTVAEFIYSQHNKA